MSLTPEQYLALTQIAYTNFTDWPAAQNMTISQLLDAYDLSGEGTQTVAALSNMGSYTLINYQANTTSGFAGAAFQAPISFPYVYKRLGTSRSVRVHPVQQLPRSTTWPTTTRSTSSRTSSATTGPSS